MMKSSGDEDDILRKMRLEEEDDEVIWDINDESIGPIPAFHPPMDKKCVKYVHETNVNIIVDRITSCLRDLSVVAEYEVATVHAITSNRVRFHINLYRGNSDSFENGVIVECVRIRGCVRAFHKINRDVLSAASGTVAKSHVPRRIVSIPLSSSTTSNELGLEIAWSLLKKDRLDANTLGMESMVHLTDANVATCALYSAHAVLGIEEEDERFTEIHELILSLIRDPMDFLQDYNEQEDLEHISTMRSLAFQVLLNSLQAVISSSSTYLQTALENIVTEGNILPYLLDEIDKTFSSNGSNAHDATLAMQIFHVLITHSTSAQQYIVKDCNNSLHHDVFYKAYRVARKRHKKLQGEILNAVQFLENLCQNEKL